MALGKLSRAPLPKEARRLVDQCREFFILFDGLMSMPSSVERGKKMARLVSSLEFAVDSFEHFGMKCYPPKRRIQNGK